MNCALCVPNGEVVFEDDETWVALHDDWAVLGHAMVVSKQHVENVSNLDERAWLHFARVWHRTERALLTLTGAERCVVLKLGILTPHLHVHLYPVSAADSRTDVFAAFAAEKRVPRNETFVVSLREHLTPDHR